MRRTLATRFAALTLAMSAFVLASCGGQSSGPPPTSSQTPAKSTPSTSETGPALPRIDLPVQKDETVEGLVDVNGHDIYARCSGTGAPTVIYFTGWAPDPSKLAVSAIQGIESVDQGRHRICFLRTAQHGAQRDGEGDSDAGGHRR